MFAKLKKKIEEQGGNVPDAEKFNSGNASTLRKGTRFSFFHRNLVWEYHHKTHYYLIHMGYVQIFRHHKYR